MKTISRYIMTLALLLTAVTGAWAEEKMVTINSSTMSSGAVTATGFNIIFDNYLYVNSKTATITTSEGVITKLVIKKCDVYGDAFTEANVGVAPGTITYGSDEIIVTDINAESVTLSRKGDDNWSTSSVDVYYGTAEAPITVEPGSSANTWTFAMPANDVVLTPVYAEATILNNHDQTETSYASLKEAFANVKEGDIIKLDWNVTLNEQLTTPERNGDPIHFILDFNGYTITDGSGMAGYNCIELRNGDVMFLTDESKDKNGGLKGMVAGLQGSRIVFVGGRYDFGEELTATNIKNMWVNRFALDLGWSIALDMEFIDLNNGSADADGFFVCVGFKTFDLAIDSKRFATFYADKNIKLAEQTAEGVGLYTISSINADRSTATVTPISGIIPAGTPMLVYNGTEQKQTAKLIVTLDNAQDAIAWADQFKGTATDKTFDADDMAKADYYALSGGKAFAPVKGTGTLGANQCWLQFDKQEISSARQFTLVFDETTGLSGELRVKSEEFATATWYTLDGRKIAAPSKKGIYIMNGKKIVVK